MLVAVPVFFVAMPWLIRVVFGSEYDGAVHAARIDPVAAAIHFVARLDEVAARHDRAAAAADRDPRARDARRDPARRRARAPSGARRAPRSPSSSRRSCSPAPGSSWSLRLRDEVRVRRPTGRRSSREGRRRLRDLAARSRRAGEPRAGARRLPRGAGTCGRGRDDGGLGAGARARIPSRGRRVARRCDTCARRCSFARPRAAPTSSTRRA